jgi:DNA-binding NtrC family response regulator
MRHQILEDESTGPGTRVPRKKLLLVDDNFDELLYYTAILRHLAFEVRPCASFTQAANLFAREDFDLVIVSQGGSAFEARGVLARAMEADGNIPVLVLARHADLDCYAEAVQMGAVDQMEKPLTPSEVAELVTKYIRLDSPAKRTPIGVRADWSIAR